MSVCLCVRAPSPAAVAVAWWCMSWPVTRVGLLCKSIGQCQCQHDALYFLSRVSHSTSPLASDNSSDGHAPLSRHFLLDDTEQVCITNCGILRCRVASIWVMGATCSMCTGVCMMYDAFSLFDNIFSILPNSTLAHNRPTNNSVAPVCVVFRLQTCWVTVWMTVKMCVRACVRSVWYTTCVSKFFNVRRVTFRLRFF